MAEKPKLKFRNYQPKAEELKDGAVAPSAVVPLPEAPVAAPLVPVTTVVTTEQQQQQQQQEAPTVLDVAPKHPNFDLKRDIADKMKVLEKRTQRAIIELTRERILAENNNNAQGGEGSKNDSLVSAVNMIK